MSTLSKQVQKVVQLCKGRTTKQVIDDLIQMHCNLICNPKFIEVVFPSTLYQYNSEFAQDLAYYHTNPQAMQELTVLAGMFRKAILESEPFSDVMGLLYDMEIQGNTFGQFLTPPDIADLVAELAVTVDKPFNEPRTIGDDMGCGAGGLILGLINAIYRTQGKGAVRNLDVRAVDMDINMVKIATVQIVLNSCIHRIPVKSFLAHHANILTEYDEMQERQHRAYCWMPALPSQVYQQGFKGTKQISETEQQTELETA